MLRGDSRTARDDVVPPLRFPDAKLRKVGLPLRAGFWGGDGGAGGGDDDDDAARAKKRAAARAAVGLPADDVPTALVVGGGDGVGGIAPIAEVERISSRNGASWKERYSNDVPSQDIASL